MFLFLFCFVCTRAFWSNLACGGFGLFVCVLIFDFFELFFIYFLCLALVFGLIGTEIQPKDVWKGSCGFLWKQRL